MSLQTTINSELVTAMKAQDAVRLRGLRAIKAAILLANTAENSKELDADSEIALLQRLVKQRRDSLDIFTTQNRPDLAVREEEEIAVIVEFLPKQLSREEVAAAVHTIVAEIGASSMKDMGRVMGAASKQLAGKTEGKLISEIVKEVLSA
ncbi:MAG: hypothetical protein RI894_2419 [Bacteroidota bacterium]